MPRLRPSIPPDVTVIPLPRPRPIIPSPEEIIAEPPAPSPCQLRLTTEIAIVEPLPRITGANGCGIEDPVRLSAVMTKDKVRVAITPPATLRCTTAEALAHWIREDMAPIAATLAMYIALQGMSFLLRDSPDGYINFAVTEWINWQWGPIPVAFIVLVAVACAAEYMLRKSKAGWRLRAVGSDEESARRTGVRIDRTFVAGYIVCSLLTAMGAVMLMTQIGVGDPRQGVNYTLSSITAVVLGGTSLKGGRGTFIGTVLGAVLLTEVLNAVTFLGLSQTYQYVFQGALIVAAALIYSAARKRVGA